MNKHRITKINVNLQNQKLSIFVPYYQNFNPAGRLKKTKHLHNHYDQRKKVKESENHSDLKEFSSNSLKNNGPTKQTIPLHFWLTPSASFPSKNLEQLNGEDTNNLYRKNYYHIYPSCY